MPQDPAPRHDASMRLAVNGRFLTRDPTGVDRVAIEMLAALAERPDIDAIDVYYPKAVSQSALRVGWIDNLSAPAREKLTLIGVGRFSGHAWEQFSLPHVAKTSVLLNFCGSGPVVRKRQMIMIHDAQIFDVPQSYSTAFKIFFRMIFPILGARSRYVATVSNYSKSRLVHHGVAKPDRVTVLPNGADHMRRGQSDLDALARHGLTPGRFILAIGSLAPHKNLGTLLQAASQRETGDVPVAIVGTANARVFQGMDHEPQAGATWLGRVSDRELKALYENATALAFPSITEGFGLPPLEAMTCGCPVIASTGGAIPEVCADAALYVDPFDVASWAAAMDRVVQEPDFRDDLARKGRRRSQRFSWSDAAQGLVNMLAHER